MGRILVTTDLSEESTVAFEVASRYAKATESDITLIAIIVDPAGEAVLFALENPIQPNQDIQQQMFAKVQETLEEYREKFFDGIDTECVVLKAERAVHTEILRFTRAEDIELIVMAKEGHSRMKGIKERIIGSTTERVAKSSPCPVMIVPFKE